MSSNDIGITEASHLVGWRTLCDQDAIFRNTVGEFGRVDDVLIEQVAELAIRATRTATLHFMLSKVTTADEVAWPEILVTSQSETDQLRAGQNLGNLLRRTGRESYTLRGIGDGTIWLGANAPFESQFRAAGCREPACVEVGIREGGEIRVQDLSQYGTAIYADWSAAFVGANIHAPEDAVNSGRLVYLSSKSTG